MSRYNRFGATHATAMALYPGTVTADYDAGGTSGQTKIEGALDRAVFEIAGSLTPEAYSALTKVEAEEVVSYATANQTAWTLGIRPVVAGTVHLWIYPLMPAEGTEGSESFETWLRAPTRGYNEVLTSSYSVTATTGAIAYSGPAIQEGQRVYATYNVDVDNAAFSVPMLAQIANLGAAAELGEVLYSASTQEWALVTQYRNRYTEMLKQLKDGSLIPDEVRALTYFKEIERKNEMVRSVRFLRG